MKFIILNIDRIFYIYSNILTIENLVADFIRIQSAMNEEGNKVIVAAAVHITKNARCKMQDEILWKDLFFFQEMC